MFEILIDRPAEKDLRRISDVAHKRITSAINSLALNPRPTGVKKLAGAPNDWRIRVGEYRVLYEISDAIRIVRVFRIRHRREVYR